MLPLPQSCRLIPGFPCYCVSPNGKVYSRRVYGSINRSLGPWWEMKPKGSVNKNRYLHVDLFVNVGKPVRFGLHHLVALAFIGPRTIGKIVCHKDDDRQNNRLSNLYYGTKRSNRRDAVRNGRCQLGENVYNASLTNAQVREVRRLAATGLKAKELAARTGIRKKYVYKILQRVIYKSVT